MFKWNKDWLWQRQYPPHSLIDRSMAKRSRCRQSICKPLWYEHIACTAIVHVKKCIECLVPAYPRHLSWAAHLGAPHCRAAVSPNPVVGAASRQQQQDSCPAKHGKYPDIHFDINQNISQPFYPPRRRTATSLWWCMPMNSVDVSTWGRTFHELI